MGRIIKRGIGTYIDNSMSVFAGYSTLFIVMALFPFIMLIISVINLFPGYSADDVAALLFQILPDLEPIEKLVGSMITNLKDQSNGLLASVAAVTTLWSASKGVSAIQKGLNQLDRDRSDLNDTDISDDAGNKQLDSGIKGIIGSSARATAKRLLFTLMLVILIPAALVFEMLGSTLIELIGRAIEKISPEALEKILPDIDLFFLVGSVAVLIFALLVIIVVYAYLPNKHSSFKRCLPGAVLTFVCWFAFTKLFALFIPRFFNASLYGSLASLFLMLFWLLIMVTILFAGAILNRSIEEELK